MKKKIIIISLLILIVMSSGIVFAAYRYTKKNTISAKTGTIDIVSENYLSYSLNEDANKSSFTTAEYKAILKERAGATKVDTSNVSSFESDVAAYSYFYTKSVEKVSADATFDSNTKYYILDNIGTYVLQEDLTAFESGVTYYNINYGTATSSTTEIYRLGHQITTSTTESNYASYYVLDGVDGQGYALFSAATSYSSDEVYFEIVYAPKTTTTNGTITDEDTGSTINCINTYATEKKVTSQEQNYIYLNQLGFQFQVKTTIKAYVRIKFYDAWISSKLYPGSVSAKTNYISKGQISGRSPFYVNNDNWYYDSSTNVCYLKVAIDPSDLNYLYTFNINDTYFYTQNSNTVYTENILVQVSYSLELIQANRAKAVWGVDPSSLGGEN